ncbi:MAG: metallophosphoesterase [Clostridia bacterium]|nr:metallophosphoesterase [Clostridia bacterium]
MGALFISTGCRTQQVASETSPSAVALTPAPTPVQEDIMLEAATAQPTMTPVPTPTPTPVPTPVPTPTPTPFVICHISDTQYYSYTKTAAFTAITQYLVDSAEEMNIILTVHTGDIVDNLEYERHWLNSTSAIEILDGELPFYCVAGNHDVGTSAVNYSYYTFYDFNDMKDSDKKYEDGVCWYETFNAGGTDFLLLGIGWQVNNDFLPWCQAVLEAHPDHVAIILVHSFIHNADTLSSFGEILEENLVQPYANVRLILCGHNDGSVNMQLEYEDHTVNALMYNFQDDKEEGLGYMRLLTFDPLARTISVTTYSPYLDKEDYYADESRNAFILLDAF